MTTLTTEVIDIHDFAGRLERAELRLHNPLSEKNKELILDFEKALFTEGLTKIRITKYVETLRRIGEMLGKNFDQVTKADIENFVYKLEKSDYSPWTKHDYKVVLKRFYKWLKGNNEDYPLEVKWIKTTLKTKGQLLPEELVTEDEVTKLVNACDNPRDKAMIMTLYETGARIGELGSLRIKDVVFEENYARIMLNGKTGMRRIIVVASVPYLQSWLQNHPYRNAPLSPLWINMGTLNKYGPMSYSALAKVLRVAAEKAKLSKKVHPHKMRHSRATFLASKLTEAQMNQVLGWKQGSDMPSTYVHLSGRDTDDALLGVYGLKKAQKEEKSKLTPRVCPRCQTTNVLDAKFCSKCGLALDIKAAQELEEARSKVDDVMDVLMKDKEFKSLLLKKTKELTKIKTVR